MSHSGERRKISAAEHPCQPFGSLRAVLRPSLSRRWCAALHVHLGLLPAGYGSNSWTANSVSDSSPVVPGVICGCRAALNRCNAAWRPCVSQRAARGCCDCPPTSTEALTIAVPERSSYNVWNVDIPDAGTLAVGYHEDGLYWWRLHNRNGTLLQDGHSLTVAGEQRAPSAARAMLLFLLATTDLPLRDFNDATTVWASLNRNELGRLLGRPSGPSGR